MDCLLVLVGAPWVCFLVLSVLLLPDLVFFKLLFFGIIPLFVWRRRG